MLATIDSNDDEQDIGRVSNNCLGSLPYDHYIRLQLLLLHLATSIKIGFVLLCQSEVHFSRYIG
jgi:hypothetical protein